MSRVIVWLEALTFIVHLYLYFFVSLFFKIDELPEKKYVKKKEYFRKKIFFSDEIQVVQMCQIH